jgi:hypothetical protein
VVELYCKVTIGYNPTVSKAQRSTAAKSFATSRTRWSSGHLPGPAPSVKVTGLAQKLGQLEAVSREFQSKYWANLQLLGQPCNFYAAGGTTISADNGSNGSKITVQFPKEWQSTTGERQRGMTVPPWATLARRARPATLQRPGRLPVPRRRRRRARVRLGAELLQHLRAGARNVLGWPKRCQLARASLWEYSYKRLKLV